MPRVKAVKANVCKDIDLLIDLLKRQPPRGSKVIVEGLESLTTKIKSITTTDSWKLEWDLTFKSINKRDLKIPSIISDKIIDIFLRLKVKITEEALLDTDIKDGILQNNSISRPIKYGVQLMAYAKMKDEVESPKQYKIAWHLDKHIRSEDGEDGAGTGFIHPEYHFNMGGFAITKEANMNFGSILLMDTPRLMHPPLDSILAVDFVLNNFYGCKAQNLLKSRSYQEIVKRSKLRLWRPYFIALASQWGTNFDHLTIENNFSKKILGEI